MQARARDKEAKEQMKMYKDRGRFVKPHTIKIGDKVLLKQKPTKKKPPYDPEPFQVVDVQGTQITAKRNERILIRDSQKFKRVKEPQTTKFTDLPPTFTQQEVDSDPDIGPAKNTNMEQGREELGQDRQEVHQDEGEGLGHRGRQENRGIRERIRPREHAPPRREAWSFTPPRHTPQSRSATWTRSGRSSKAPNRFQSEG